jgi:hypothetical protein
MPKRLFGKIRIDYGPYNGTLQSKIVEPSTEDQNVVADNGYNALSLVLVKAATLQEKTVTPSSQEQTVVPDVGVYGLSKVIVKPQGEHGLLEEITVTPTQEGQRITPSEGYYGIDVVNVEAAPLEELTIYPAYEKQTFTPSEGYYGIGSIVVEAMDDPGSGDGGGGGGGEGEDPEVIPNAGGTHFGNETVTEEVETGNYHYGDYTLPGIPNSGSYPYSVIHRQDTGEIAMISYSLKPVYVRTESNGHITIRIPEGYKYMHYKRTAEDWRVYSYGSDTTESGNHATYDIIWANFSLENSDGETALEFAEPTPETETVTTTRPVDYEDKYVIGGESLNDLISIAQKITGTTESMTVEEATKVLEDYYARLNEDSTE